MAQPRMPAMEMKGTWKPREPERALLGNDAAGLVCLHIKVSNIRSMDEINILEREKGLKLGFIKIMMSYIPSLTLPARVFATPAVSILLPVTMGFGIGYAVSPKKGTPKMYLAMKQPPFRPPPWVFGPAWTTLYSLMGYAAYRAWTASIASLDPKIVELTKQGATLYTIQLGLNMIWSPLFFGIRRPIAALVDIVVLWGCVAKLIQTWSQVDEIAGWCLAPYLGWLTFAIYLNAGVGYLNEWDISDKELMDSPTTGKNAESTNAKRGN